MAVSSSVIRDSAVRSHLYVVAEDLVVAHLQRPDAGAAPLALLELGEVPPGIGRRRAELIQLAGEAGSDDLTVAQGRGRIISQGVLDQRHDIVAGPQLGEEPVEGLFPLQDAPQVGQQLQAVAERDQLPWRGDSRAHPVDESLDVAELAEQAGRLGAARRHEAGDGPVAPLQFRYIEQGLPHPFLEQPSPHGRLRQVDHG
jgi:hypothetical protein